MHTTGAEIGGVQAGTTSTLIEHHELFAFFEAPQRRGQSTHVHRLRGHVQQVVQDAPNLGIQHPDQRTPARHLNPGQLFDGQTPCVFLVHRRHIIQTVEIRQVLQIRPAFHQLFGATVQQADMRIAALDNLAVQLKHQTQNPVCRRVLRAEVDVEIADLLFSAQRVRAAVIVS